MISTKFDPRVSYFLLIACASSFLLSLFLLQLFVGLISILWLLESFENKKKAFDIFGTALIIFCVCRIIAIIFSEFPQESIQSLYKEALFYLGFFSFSFYFKTLNKEKIFKIISSFAAAASAISLIGIILFNLQYVDRAQSFTSGYSTFSSYLLTGLGITVCFPYLIQQKKNIFLYIAGTVLILTGIITSLGRVNIAIAVLIVMSAFFIRKIKFKIIFAIILFTALFSYLSFLNNQSEISNRIEQPAQLSDRDIIYEGAQEILFEHPIIGFGPRTFHKIFPFKEEFADKGIGSWHNDFLQIYFEGGMFGLAAFLFLILIPLTVGIKILRKNILSENERAVTYGILLSIFALVLSSLTAGFINSPVLSVVFAFLASALSAIVKKNSNQIS